MCQSISKMGNNKNERLIEATGPHTAGEIDRATSYYC